MRLGSFPVPAMTSEAKYTPNLGTFTQEDDSGAQVPATEVPS